MTPKDKIEKMIKDVFGEMHHLEISGINFKVYQERNFILHGTTRRPIERFWEEEGKSILKSLLDIKMNTSINYIILTS